MGGVMCGAAWASPDPGRALPLAETSILEAPAPLSWPESRRDPLPGGRSGMAHARRGAHWTGDRPRVATRSAETLA